MEEEKLFESVIEEQLKGLKFDQLEELMNLSEYRGEYNYDPIGIKEIVAHIINGEAMIDFGQIFDSVINIFMNEVFSAWILIGEIVLICAISGLLKSTSSSFGDSAVSGVGQIVCNYSAVAVCIANFYMTYRIAEEVIEQMIGFIQALSPIMVALLIGSGGVTTGAVMNPVILMAISIFSTIVNVFVFPAVFLSCAFFMINSLTDNNYIKKLAGYIRKTAIFTIGLCVLIFSGLSAIQGIVTASADSVLTKAAKYSVGNFVPIIGSFAADSMDLIKSCCTVIKSAAGILGIIAVLIIIAVPLLKLVAVAVIYKIGAAIAEPLGSESISDSMNEMGNTVITLAVVVFLTALMFLIFITMFACFGAGGFS